MSMDDRGDALHTLTQADVDAIAEAMIRRMRGPNWVPSEKHHDHHEWVEAKMQAEQSTKSSRRRIVENIIGTVGASSIVGVFTYLGYLIIMALKSAIGD